MDTQAIATQVERWGIFEIVLKGPQEGNPFQDVQLTARFTCDHQVLEPEGFYDGEGSYRIRFMPDCEGDWTYMTRSNCAELNGHAGTFVCIPAAIHNHGPVRVEQPLYFAYADGSPYRPFGTTCYGWHHQGEVREAQTLRTLQHSAFNKLRMCVFPLHDAFNLHEPTSFPFVGAREAGFDFGQFNPIFFRHLEKRIEQLSRLGIEADIILFHPFDKGHWGFDNMGAAADELYVRYLISRLSAYRNVWWSLANDEALLVNKTEQDAEHWIRLIQAGDPYRHLLSSYNGRTAFPYGDSAITHVSMRSEHLPQTSTYTKLYKKPVIMEQCSYEGNLEFPWGSLTGKEMVSRFWEGVCRGGYVTHGEAYLHPEDQLWLSHGGGLQGQSAERIAFLRSIIDDAPPKLQYLPRLQDAATIGIEGEYYLQYFGQHRFSARSLKLPEGIPFIVEIIDSWEMTITVVAGTFEGACQIPLDSKPYIALRINRATNL